MPKVSGTKVSSTKTEGPGDVKASAPVGYPEPIVRTPAEIREVIDQCAELEDQLADLEAAAINRFHAWLTDEDADDPISSDE